MNTLTLNKNDKVYRLQYNSLEDFANHAMHTQCEAGAPRVSRATGSEAESYGKGWFGSDSFEESYEWSTNGWPNGQKLYQKYKHVVPTGLLDQLLPAEEFGSRWEPSVAGSLLNMGDAVCYASPLHFLTEVEDNLEVRRGKNIQRIVVNGVNAAYTDPELFALRGILAYSLVDHIESLGYSTELWTEITVSSRGGSSGSREYLTTMVKLKGFGEFLNLDRVMFALSNASLLRRLWFGEAELLPKFLRQKFSIGASYGSCVGVATRQKPQTLVLDVHSIPKAETLIEVFSDQVRKHYLSNDVEFNDEQKEIK